MRDAARGETQEEIGSNAEFSWGHAKAEGGVFVFAVLGGRYDLNRGLEWGFQVLRVGEGDACHHVDDLLSRAVSWLSAVDV